MGLLLLAAGCAQESGVASVLVVSSVQVTPPNGEVVLGQTLQLTATPKTEGGIPLPAQNVTWSSTDVSKATVDAAGVVTGHGVGSVGIRATVEGITGATQVTVVPLPVDHVIVTPPSASLVVGQQSLLTATAYDAANRVLTGRTFTWSSAAPDIAAVTTTGLAIGMAEGGPVQITATAGGKSGNASVTVGPRAATRLGFLQQPSSAAAGDVLTPPIRVVVQDDVFGTVAGATNSITIALANNPGNATLTGTRTVAAVNGVATFSDLALDRAAKSYTVTATSPGLTSAISLVFDITAGGASQLSFATAPPATAASGIPLATTPVVQIEDANGNPAPSAGVPVTVAISGSGATLGGVTTVTTGSSGAAAFSGLTITGPVGIYTLSFTAPGLSVLNSASISLTAGNAVAIAVSTQPAPSARSGIVLAPQPAVRLIDGVGNTVPQAGVPITATIQSGPAGGALSGTTTVNTGGTGVVTFTNLELNGPTGSYVLRFAGSGLTAVSSNPIVLGGGNAAALTLTVQPSSQASPGQPFPQQPVVQLRDGSGNSVSQSGVVVIASIQTGGGSLGGGTTATTNGSGAAAFTGLSLTGPAGSYTLAFAASGITGDVSNPVLLSAPPATALALVTQPSSAAVNGAVFPQQPVVQLLDGLGNPAAQAGVPVSVAISAGGGTLGGVATVNTDASGRATFAGLSITGPVGTYTLAFSSAGRTGVTSGPITLTAGPAAALLIATQPSATASNGVPFPQQPVVNVQDGSGNAVAGVLVTVTVGSGGGSLGGTATATSDANGVAAFSGLSISGTIGTRTLDFAAPGVPTVTSTTIDLTAGPVTRIVIVQQPSGSASHNNPFPRQPIVQLFDADGNVVAGASVTAAINSVFLGTGKLIGTVTITSDAAGLATFTDLAITKSGFYTLKFTAGAAVSPASSQITIS